jgi:hypothetical protein
MGRSLWKGPFVDDHLQVKVSTMNEKNEKKVNLPSVPGFELPPPSADGAKSVKELRVKGKKLLDTDVTVKGVVTWV